MREESVCERAKTGEVARARERVGTGRGEIPRNGGRRLRNKSCAECRKSTHIESRNERERTRGEDANVAVRRVQVGGRCGGGEEVRCGCVTERDGAGIKIRAVQI